MFFPSKYVQYNIIIPYWSMVAQMAEWANWDQKVLGSIPACIVKILNLCIILFFFLFLMALGMVVLTVLLFNSVKGTILSTTFTSLLSKSSQTFWTFLKSKVQSTKASSDNSTSWEYFLQSLLIEWSITFLPNNNVNEISKWSPKQGFIDWTPPPQCGIFYINVVKYWFKQNIIHNPRPCRKFN